MEPILSKAVKPARFIAYSPANTTDTEQLTKLASYHNAAENQTYLLLFTTCSIHRYQMNKLEWQCIAFLPLCCRPYHTSIDQQHHKIYILSPWIFAIFDLLTLKWNLLKSHTMLTDHFDAMNRNDRFTFVHHHHNNTNSNPSKSTGSISSVMVNDVVCWKYLNESTQAAVHKGIKTEIDSEAGTVHIQHWQSSIMPTNIKLSLQDTQIFYTDYSQFDHDCNLPHILESTTFYFYELVRQTFIAYSGSFTFRNGDVSCIANWYSLNGQLAQSIWFDPWRSRPVDHILMSVPNELYMLEVGGDPRKTWIYTASKPHSRQIWTERLSFKFAFNRHFKFVADASCLVKDSIFILFDCERGHICCIDLKHNACVVRLKAISSMNLYTEGCRYQKVQVAYDALHETVHFVLKAVSETHHLERETKQKHYAMDLFDLLPKELFCDTLVYGFFRRYERIFGIDIPLALCDLVVLYYPLLLNES